MARIKLLPSTKWTTIKHLDREIEIEIADKQAIFDVLKDDENWIVALNNLDSAFHFLFTFDDFLTVNYESSESSSTEVKDSSKQV